MNKYLAQFIYKRSKQMKQAYIIYFEGFDRFGELKLNGNHGATASYTDHVDVDEFITTVMSSILNIAQSKNPDVVRVVIKNMFKL